MIRRTALAVALSIAGSLLFATAALAAPQRATIEVTTTAAPKLTQGYAVNVRVRGADGKPVNEAEIRFFEKVDLFGAREMYIGSTMTDGQGGGTFLYLPAQLGSHQLIARFAGRDQIAPSEGRATFEATVAAPDYRVQPVPLAGFSTVVTAAVGVIVLSVWALIAFALVSTARGVLRGARDLERKGNQA